MASPREWWQPLSRSWLPRFWALGRRFSVEGHAAASFLKLWAGRYLDGSQGGKGVRQRLPSLARSFLALVSSWGALLQLRRPGLRGAATTSRDALLAVYILKTTFSPAAATVRWTRVRRAAHCSPLQHSASYGCTLLYGVLAGMGEGSERVLISLYADERERGTAFGWYHPALGLSAIPAGV